MHNGTELKQIFSLQALHTVFDEWIESDYFYVGEQHDFWELVVVAEGQVGITAGERTWVMQQGQAVLHPPMEFHRVWYPGVRGRIIILSFSAKDLSPKFGGNFCVADMTIPEELLRKSRRRFSIEGIFVTDISHSDIATQVLIKQWELFLLKLIGQNKLSATQTAPRTAKNYTTIVQVLESHLHENLSIAQVAELCNISEICAKQTFSKYTGMGIMRYFNQMKIQRAIQLLQSGCSVQETSDTLGFSSQNYFSTVFKRITGKAPTAYR